MTTEFRLPELGEGVTSGTVANVLVSSGDTVSAEDPVIEIETDKAVAEIPIPFDGKVTDVKVKSGDRVNVGQVVLLVEKGGGNTALAKEEEPGPKKVEAPKAEKKPETRPEPSQKLKVNLAARNAAPAVAVRRTSGRVLASPSVRKLARTLGVGLEDVPTADPSGRVTARDVESYAVSDWAEGGEMDGREDSPGAAPASTTPVPVYSGPPAVSGAQSVDRWGAVVRESMSGIRKKTVEHMAQSWNTIPHVTHFEKADVTVLEQLRKQYADGITEDGGSLTLTVFILKVIAEALRRFPKFNASLDIDCDEVILKQYYHIGVTVNTPAGLLVPAIRDVDQKTLQDLAMELPAIAKKAHDRKLTLEDVSGTTFTISNLGGLGGAGFTPIISSPEVANLGVSRATTEGIFQNGQIEPRTMLPLSLSYDHRLIDGADAARFMRWVTVTLESPWKLILES